MPAIHDDIEPWLAAAVHDQLSADERAAFDAHIADCATCRALHQEETNMSKLIRNTLAADAPDGAFEQRILSGFRRNVPRRSGNIITWLRHVSHMRATQVTAVAALLLGLVQLGQLVTGEGSSPLSPPTEMTAAAPADGQRARASTAQSKADAARPDVTSSNGLTRGASPQGRSYADTGSGTTAPPPAAAPRAASRVQQAPTAAATESVELREEQAAASAPDTSTSADDMAYATEPERQVPAGTPDNRKLIRNAQVELEVIKFDDAVQKITGLAGEIRGFVATSSSQKQENGKLRGELVVKVLPETLDAFLLKLRDVGEVKNQTLGTEDVTKQYFDTDSRLKNARVMEQRLIDILKTKTGKVSDLLEVEKELGRVRAEIERMQGELKYMDAQIQFATVTITLAEKEMDLPAAFLLKRRAQLALFSTDVEKTFAEVKGVIDGAKAQISSSSLDRDSAGEATARLTLLIVPEEADAVIDRIKGMGRVQNFNEQTDRVAQGGSGMAENAKVERDKVELSITISRTEQEPALQTTSLRILTSDVSEKAARLKENAAKSGAEIRNSSFSRNPNGQEFANITLRLPMKNYQALMNSFDQLGKVKDVSVHRQDRRGIVNEETAPADITIQVYSQGNIVSEETGIIATIRRTLGQGAAALMWSLRMIGVAVAFLAPWALAIAALVWVLKRLSRARRARKEASEQV